MLLCICSLVAHRWLQNVVGKSVMRSLYDSCATFFFVPHFDVICDLLLNSRTSPRKLCVNYFIADVSKASLQSHYDVTSLDNELRLLNSTWWSEQFEIPSKRSHLAFFFSSLEEKCIFHVLLFAHLVIMANVARAYAWFAYEKFAHRRRASFVNQRFPLVQKRFVIVRHSNWNISVFALIVGNTLISLPFWRYTFVTMSEGGRVNIVRLNAINMVFKDKFSKRSWQKYKLT